MPHQPGPSAAIVMSGGGARGAYEAGVLAGLVDVLGLEPGSACPFSVFAGTSIGSLNAAWMASRAHQGDLGARELCEVWTEVRLSTQVRFDLRGLLGLKSRLSGQRAGTPMPDTYGHHVLDPRPLERMAGEVIDWDAVHTNIGSGRVHALICAALHIATGRTVMFAELAPGVQLSPMTHPRVIDRAEPLSAAHVLASSALPLMLPSRRIGNAWYTDGGLRFNTPLLPAIRAGARKAVVVHTNVERLNARPGDPGELEVLEEFPKPAFLLGKVLNALLQDPIVHDLYVLQGMGRLRRELAEKLPPELLAQVLAVMDASGLEHVQGAETLEIQPSVDLGVLAAAHLEERTDLASALRRLVPTVLSGRKTDSDLATYLLFDGSFARRLIDLGRKDAVAMADQVLRFLA